MDYYNFGTCNKEVMLGTLRFLLGIGATFEKEGQM